MKIIGDLNIDQADVDASVEMLSNAGMEVVKVLSYKDGPTKYIAKICPGKQHHEVRRVLEESGWSIGSPYYSMGVLQGFKVTKVVAATDVSAWGG